VVIITGTSSGIGRDLALEMAETGYTVFATVRKQQDGDGLLAAAKSFAKRIHIFLVDVAKPEDIARVSQEMEKTLLDLDLPLAGLVNNAGYAALLPAELTSHDAFVSSLRVNLMGTVDLCRALMPTLRARKGRIVNIGSIAAWFVPPWYGNYAAAKAGLSAWSSSLRREVACFGVSVSVVEPGSIKTSLQAKMSSGIATVLETLDRTEFPGADLYSVAPLQRMFRMGRAASAEHVVRAVRHALESRFPKTRYLVGWDARLFALLSWLMDEAFLDLALANFFAEDAWWEHYVPQ